MKDKTNILKTSRAASLKHLHTVSTPGLGPPLPWPHTTHRAGANSSSPQRHTPTLPTPRTSDDHANPSIKGKKVMRTGEATAACQGIPTQPALIQWEEIPSPRWATRIPITLLAKTGFYREQNCVHLHRLPSRPSSALQSQTSKQVPIHTTASNASRVILNPLV